MKKKILLPMALFLTCTALFAQIGINTPTPLRAFHVDAAKDNPTSGSLTSTQQANDFVVNANGSVGIGTISPDSSAKLDVSTSNQGFLPPRVDLTSYTMDLDGISGQATGLLVYNIGTNISPGYYYWDGTRWRRFSLGAGITQNITFVTGSRTSANPYIVQDNDYYVFIRLSGTISGPTNSGSAPDFINTNYNIQLPNPALFPGRELYLINDSDGVNGTSVGVNAFTNYPIYGTYINGISTNYATGDGGDYRIQENYPKVKIVSDGVRWIAVQVTIV